MKYVILSDSFAKVLTRISKNCISSAPPNTHERFESTDRFEQYT